MSAWTGIDQYLEYFNSPDSDLQGGDKTVSMSAGSFASALLAGWLSDKLGRKCAQNVGHLIAGRVINGFTVDIMSSQVPVYLAELSPKDIRGRVAGIQQWAIESVAIPALFLIPALLFFTKSPRWLASKYRWEEALDAEYEEVREAQAIAAQASQLGWFGLFGPTMWRRMMAARNINLVFYLVQYVIFLVTTAITLIFIDKWGRRPLFIYGGVAMGALSLCVARLMAHYWIYNSEVFPLQYRTKGVGLVTATNWILNFALAYFVPPAFRNISWKTYIIFGVFFAVLSTASLCSPKIEAVVWRRLTSYEKGVAAWKASKFEDKFAIRVGELERKGGRGGRESEDKRVAGAEKVETV
ncbi:glucose transporter [Tirmania nivea]|nr:glucose transporter [Tirmania nivea]